jgi:ribulose-phosphate 3-epimerase
VSNLRCAASLQDLDLLNLQHELDALVAADVDELHCDIADGHFSPGFGLGTDLLNALKGNTKLPCAAHLMTKRPQDYLPTLLQSACDTIYLHVESQPHLHQCLTQIREYGATPGIAINPTTPLTKVDYILPLVDRVLLTSGRDENLLLPAALERAKILGENIRYNEYRIQIDAEGDFDLETAAKFAAFGTELFVLRKMHLNADGSYDYRKNIDHFRTQATPKNITH